MTLPPVPVLPLITPANSVLALEIVKVLSPKRTAPELLPAKVTTVIPLVLPVISKVAFTVMPEELAIEPLPVIAKVPPETVVAPVYWLMLERVNLPTPDLDRVALLPERIAPIVISAALLIVKLLPLKIPVVLRIAPEVRVKLPAVKFVVPRSKVPPAIVTSPPLGNTPLPDSAIVPALILVPPLKVLFPKSVRMPAPLFTKLVDPLIAPVMRLPLLEELIVKVETLETVPPMVAAPLPELMVRAATPPEPLVPSRFPETITTPEPPAPP